MQTKFTADSLAVQEVIRINDGPKVQYLSNLLREGRVLRVPSGMSPTDFHVSVPAVAGPLERCKWCCSRIWPVILNGAEYYDANCDWNSPSDWFADLSSPHRCLTEKWGKVQTISGADGESE
jgi:hypothetical protein